MPSADTLRLTALIPAHNEAATIAEVIAGTRCHVGAVLVVDDGSTDGTAEAARMAGAAVLRLEENRGKGGALQRGLGRAFAEGAEAVITLDADRQHDPGAIPAFRATAKARPGAFVLGDRSAGFAGMAANRAMGIAFGNFFIGWACARRIHDAQCGMRLYPRALWEHTAVPDTESRGFLFETAILIHAADAGIPFATVPIAVRREGYVLRPSHFHPIWDFMRLFALVTRMLAARGFRPRGLLIALGLLR